MRPHDLRHILAYQLADQTGELAYELDARSGHGSQRYIQRYKNLRWTWLGDMWKSFDGGR